MCNFQICFSMNDNQKFDEEKTPCKFEICCSMNNPLQFISEITLNSNNNVDHSDDFENTKSLEINPEHNTPKVTNKRNENYGNQHKKTISLDLKVSEASPKAKKKLKCLNPFTKCFTRQKEKKSEECNICFVKYENTSFKKKCAVKKIILPCCRQHICNVCKDERIKEADKNGLEVVVENKTPNEVVKCLKCPYCLALIPQNEAQNDLLLKIKNDSIKLHEQMALMQQAEVDVLLAIMAQGKDPYRGNYGYWPIVMKYISKHDQFLFTLIENLEK